VCEGAGPAGEDPPCTQSIELNCALIAELSSKRFPPLHAVSSMPVRSKILCQGRGSADNRRLLLPGNTGGSSRMGHAVERLISKARNEPPDIAGISSTSGVGSSIHYRNKAARALPARTSSLTGPRSACAMSKALGGSRGSRPAGTRLFNGGMERIDRRHPPFRL